jgi:hypothetical protein
MAINKHPNEVRPTGSPLPSVTLLLVGTRLATMRRLIQKQSRTDPKAIPNKAHFTEKISQKIPAYPSSFIQSHFSAMLVALDKKIRNTITPAPAAQKAMVVRLFMK